MEPSGRLHAMDNLRALAMLAGVGFHAGLAYSPIARPLFPTADRDGSALVDVALWILHLFRMPLFFVVAGFFAALLVQRRGLSGMVRNRLLRIALPLVVALPLMDWALTASTLHAAATVQHPSPLLERHRGHAPWLLAGSMLAYAAFLSLVAAGGGAASPWLLAMLEALVSVWMTSVCLSWGSVLLARSNALLRYLADASYWTYLLHLPVLFAIQYRLMDWALAWPAKFAIAVAATLAVCLASYHLLVRPTPLARVLGGARRQGRVGTVVPTYG